MRNVTFAFVAAVVVASAFSSNPTFAQLTLVDQTRSLQAHGNPTADPNLSDSNTATGVYNQSEQFSNTSMLPYDNGGGLQTQTDTASAEQNSLVSASELSGMGTSQASISFTNTVNPDPITPAAEANAMQTYSVDFTVAGATPISLSAGITSPFLNNFGPGGESTSITLTDSAPSPAGGAIFTFASDVNSGEASTTGGAAASLPFVTVLEPGQTYTLTASASASANVQQTENTSESYNFDLTTSVPEPGGIVFLAGSTLLVSRWRARRQVQGR